MRTTRGIEDRELRRARLLAARSRGYRSITRAGILSGHWDLGAVVRAHLQDGTARPDDACDKEQDDG